MKIRFALPADFKSILEVAESISSKTEKNAQFNWPSDVLVRELECVKTLVGVSGSEIVSFLCYRDLPDFFEISVLATRKAFQKQSFQTALIKYLQQLAAKHNRAVILEVHAANTAAQGLYQKMGFLLLNSREKYYSDGASASVMKWDNNKAGC